MVRARYWVLALVVFWGLFGIALLASSTDDYSQLVEQAGAADINQQALAVFLVLVALLSFTLLVSAGVLGRRSDLRKAAVVRAGVIIGGLNMILFGLFGLLQTAAAAQASCPSLGFGASRCQNIKSSYETTGWVILALACASILSLLIVVAVARSSRGPQPPTLSSEAEVINQLQALAALRESGALTEQEFLSRKARLLGEEAGRGG